MSALQTDKGNKEQSLTMKEADALYPFFPFNPSTTK